VLGLSVIRGASVPVLDIGGLLGRGGKEALFRRFVTLGVEHRSVALAVEAVLGVVTFRSDALSALPPLLAHAASGVVEAMTLHDQALLLVLQASRVVPLVPEPSHETTP
jgi:chemotaxis signal transduction protein